MSRSTALTRRLSGALVFLLLPAVASAHTSLRRSEPARGSRLALPPTQIALWFTARPQLGFSRIRLVGPSGEIALDRVVADTGNALISRIPRALPPGQYTVQWQTASADGHEIRGEIAFAVLDEGQTAGTAPIGPGRHVPESQVHTENRGTRWLEFMALLSVLGALGFRHGVLPPLAARAVSTANAAERARRIGLVALGVYAVASILRLYTESVAVHGTERALDPAELLPMITTTTWGIGWLIGIAGALLVFVGWIASRRTLALGTPLALVGGLGMAFSPSLSGHAAASRHVLLSVGLDALHVAAAGVWLGGLLMMAVAGIPAMRRLPNGNADASVAALVNSFHPMALFCAPIVVVAGLGSSWLRLGSISALTGTEYGRNLLWKLMFVALVAAMGSYNWLRVRRRLGTPAATRHIRVSASMELVFAALVLAVTAALVASPAPTEMLMP